MFSVKKYAIPIQTSLCVLYVTINVPTGTLKRIVAMLRAVGYLIIVAQCFSPSSWHSGVSDCCYTHYYGIGSLITSSSNC